MTQMPAEYEAKVLKELRALNGTMWREVKGELQERDGEFAIWILLYEDSDPRESHASFCEVVFPVMEALEPIQFTVSYSVLTDILDTSVDILMDNDEIRAALNKEGFGKNTMSRARQKFSVFDAQVSGRKPQ